MPLSRRFQVQELPRPQDPSSGPPPLSFSLPHPRASYLPCPGPVGTFCPSGYNFTLRLSVSGVRLLLLPLLLLLLPLRPSVPWLVAILLFALYC